MNISKISAGQDIPHEVNVIIEIPANTGPVKYEIDKDSAALMVDRLIATAMVYPANYGFIPHTLAPDGDPVDVLVLTPSPLLAGAVIATRPIGVLNMIDESGEDVKILAVPTKKLTQLYNQIQAPEDLPAQTLQQIEHFFSHYKDLEAGKWVKLAGWQDATAAKALIQAAMV